MPAKKRRLENSNNDLEANPAKKQKLSKEFCRKPQWRSNICNGYNRKSEKTQYANCKFQHRVEYGMVKQDGNTRSESSTRIFKVNECSHCGGFAQGESCHSCMEYQFWRW